MAEAERDPAYDAGVGEAFQGSGITVNVFMHVVYEGESNQGNIPVSGVLRNTTNL